MLPAPTVIISVSGSAFSFSAAAMSENSCVLFAARNELERFISINTGLTESFTAELQRRFNECKETLANAILRQEMLRKAVEIKEQTCGRIYE